MCFLSDFRSLVLNRRVRQLTMSNCHKNVVIALHALSLLFCHFINTTANHLGRYEPSFAST